MSTPNGRTTPRNGSTPDTLPPRKRRPAPKQRHRKVRLVGATIAFEVVTDDGAQLAPLPVDVIRVAAEAWPPDVTALLADLEQRVNQTAPPEAAG